MPTAGPVLEDFSLDVPRFGVLGVRGPSGRGKSTLLKLLMRYWDPSSGTVRMSGAPLPDVSAAHRRRVQALMGQETHLFDGSIRDNLLIALPEETIRALGGERGDSSAAKGAVSDGGVSESVRLDETLREACRKASVLELIDSLPEGLDTPVGELGDRLSEGERQRIGLARVFLRDADLVLFDEPTSRLDALNEAVILRSIQAFATGEGETPVGKTGAGEAGMAEASVGRRRRAVVLVSHRESAMRVADRILTF